MDYKDVIDYVATRFEVEDGTNFVFSEETIEGSCTFDELSSVLDRYPLKDGWEIYLYSLEAS